MKRDWLPLLLLPALGVAAFLTYGALRLLANEPGKAFQLMTNLHELKGFEEKIGARRAGPARANRV